MSKNEILLDLLLFRPKAYLLLSYLNLLAYERKSYCISLYIKEIRPMSGRVVLTEQQVRIQLKLLSEREYIIVEKKEFITKSRTITILEKGFIYV